MRMIANLVFAWLFGVNSGFGQIASETPRMTVGKETTMEDQNGKKIQYIRFENDRSIALEHCKDISIYCCEAHSIVLRNCESIHIENCWVHGSSSPGIQVEKCSGIIIQGCRMDGVASGVYALDSAGIQVIGSYCENVQGPMPRGQFVQFDNIKGVGSAIRGNYCMNYVGHSKPEDVVSMYESEGTKESPILIERNYFMGDPRRGSAGKSATGSGIMLGDYGGAFIVCRDNVVINAGQVGIGIAGGTSIRVEGNLVIGAQSDVSNVGIYAWNQSKKPGADISVTRNRVLWTDQHGELNGFWNGHGFENLVVQENEFTDARLAKDIPPPPSAAPLPPMPLPHDRGGVTIVELPWSKDPR
jgi:Right handed beta helix region